MAKRKRRAFTREYEAEVVERIRLPPMRFRSSALALLGALAALLASTGAHHHADRGRALDKPCTICAVRAQSVATDADSAIRLETPHQVAIELVHHAPLARALRTHGSAAPRGPPLTY